MYSVNEINKIHPTDRITVTNNEMFTFLFNNGLLMPKSQYSIVDKYINVKEQVKVSLNLYCCHGTNIRGGYYEYTQNLRQENSIITGPDKNGNKLSNLTTSNVLVFINGYKILPSQYTITNDNTITLKNAYKDVLTSKICIYTSAPIAYLGLVNNDETWDPDLKSMTLEDYTITRYMFFLNGKLLTHDLLTYDGSTVSFNITFRPGVDTIEYYRLPIETVNCLFPEAPGYFSFGRKDQYGVEVPVLYDTIVTFTDHIVRLSIDDVRPGFFIKEEESVGNGCLMIIDELYETHSVKCLTVVPFSKTTEYTNEEYYIQVPEARSILHYLSEFDLSGKFLPEILGIFQQTLLNETYDTIQRLKNIRSINNVDSTSINHLIEFMGLRINIRNMSLEEKHALLEELTNFYKIVGTQTSYYFYNVTSVSSRIMDIEQLFTPIKDVVSGIDPIQRYVTFRTAEELGAITHREYRYPVEDYGEVGMLANAQDSLTNMPRSEGVLEDMIRGTITVGEQTYLAPIARNERLVWITDDQGNSIQVTKPVETNHYTTLPVVGPNIATENYDYGSITEEAVDFYDYGYVWEDIKGEWIEWTEWTRPTNWYPTNHVNVLVEIPPEIDYDVFMNEFKRTFYDIASAVLYIHNIIDVYVFGNDKPWEEGQKPEFGIMTSPLFHSFEYVFTNNPTIKALIPVS